MEIKLIRYYDTLIATIGGLYFNNAFQTFILEDEYRKIKIMGETRIPAGKYLLKLRTYGKFHEKLKIKYPTIHKGMIEISNVPNFTDILIHPGNTELDTKGCLLPGDSIIDRISLKNSTIAYLRIYPLIAKSISEGDTYISVYDLDRDMSKILVEL